MRPRVVYHFEARRLQRGRKLLSERRTRDGFRLLDASAAMPAGSDGRKTRLSLRRLVRLVLICISIVALPRVTRHESKPSRWVVRG
jgi:hypothetical protein